MIRCDTATVERGGRIVVEQATLAVARGEAAAIVGRSGAGKTSLLAAACAAIPLHAGDILVEGRSVRREARAVRGLVGYVPARMPAWPGIRAAEFLELAAARAGLAGPRLRDAVARGLALAGLDSAPQAEIDTLDDGRAKRLLIARAMLHDPPVVLVDDVFGGLDPFERAEIGRLIGDLQLMDRTVVAAVDDAAVPDCFTHLVVMAEGRVVAAGANDPAAFTSGNTWRYRLVTRDAGAAAARLLVARGHEAEAIDVDVVVCRVGPRRMAADLVATLVSEGVAVESAGYDPPWPVQLLR